MEGTKSELLNHLANFPNLLTTPTAPASSNNKQIPASSCMEDFGEHTGANSQSREAAT